MKKLLFIFTLMALVLSACAAAAVSGSQTEIGQNKDKWQDANISHYHYELFISCFCAFNEDMPLIIEVQDGQVVSMDFQSGNEIDPGLRATTVVLPAVAAGGPLVINVRVADGRGSALERIEAALDPSAWPPRPAIFRATPSPRSPLWPAAEPQFRRTERLHLEWDLPPATTVGTLSIVGPSGAPVDVPVTVATSARNGRMIVTADVLLASLSAGDYAVVASFAEGGRDGQSASGIRVVR